MSSGPAPGRSSRRRWASSVELLAAFLELLQPRLPVDRPGSEALLQVREHVGPGAIEKVVGLVPLAAAAPAEVREAHARLLVVDRFEPHDNYGALQPGLR